MVARLPLTTPPREVAAVETVVVADAVVPVEAAEEDSVVALEVHPRRAAPCSSETLASTLIRTVFNRPSMVVRPLVLLLSRTPGNQEGKEKLVFLGSV